MDRLLVEFDSPLDVLSLEFHDHPESFDQQLKVIQHIL